MHEPEAMTSTRLETLKEEIDAKKAFIASMPLCRNDKDILFLAKHQKILGEKEEECELLLEAQRRADVVREHEELHPPVTEECPICLEEISIAEINAMKYFGCCGNGCCRQCDESGNALTDEGVEVMTHCPLCRAEFPHVDEEEARKRNILQQAKKGKRWAQLQIGMTFFFGQNEFAIDKTESLRWLEMAAEQQHPVALCQLASFYDGQLSEDKPLHSKAKAMMKEAADLGVSTAQIHVARMYHHGEGGAVDEAKAAYYSTLGYCHDRDSHAAYQLGHLFVKGLGGLNKSLYRAKNYFEEAAGNSLPESYAPLALTLRQICRTRYDGRIAIPGHSCIPKFLFWLRRAAAHGSSASSDLVARVEEHEQEACANCHINSIRLPEKLQRCTRCKAAWYCSRSCQREAWKMGHKIDCIQQE